MLTCTVDGHIFSGAVTAECSAVNTVNFLGCSLLTRGGHSLPRHLFLNPSIRHPHVILGDEEEEAGQINLFIYLSLLCFLNRVQKEEKQHN